MRQSCEQKFVNGVGLGGKCRDGAVELYRVALMYGICLLHTVNFGGYQKWWLANVLYTCVVGFVFISGWFGIRFSWMKLAKLYGIGCYCAVISNIFAIFRGGGEFKVIVSTIHNYWFLHAYAVLMILAPYVNAVIERLPVFSRRNWREYAVMLPLLALVWIWGFGLTLPHGSDLLPRAPGLDAYGGLTLLGIYTAARAIRIGGVAERVKGVHLPVCLAALLVLTGIGLNDYNSPFAFALAFVLFLMCRRIHVPSWIERTMLWCGPSMFSIYLIHNTSSGFGLIGSLGKYFVEDCQMSAFVMYPLVALIVFCLAFTLDIPRRLFLSFCMGNQRRNSQGKGIV